MPIELTDQDLNRLLSTMNRSELIILTGYMAAHGYSAEDVAYAVEKPWKFADEYAEAQEEIAQDRVSRGLGNYYGY